MSLQFRKPEPALPETLEWHADSSIYVRVLAGLTSALLCLVLFELFRQTDVLRIRIIGFLVLGGTALVLAFRALTSAVGSVAIERDRIVVKRPLSPADTALLKDITMVAMTRGAERRHLSQHLCDGASGRDRRGLV